jgi:starvation-inducible DNA-binding protein
MNTNIGIADKNRKAVATELAKLLADEFLLYTKTRNAHWNIEGEDFHSMHLFFESQYDKLAETVDSVAERIRQLGHYAPATLKEFLDDHESVIVFLRENVNRFADDFKDTGTSDFITGLMEEHEKMAWMLRSHLA